MGTLGEERVQHCAVVLRQHRETHCYLPTVSSGYTNPEESQRSGAESCERCTVRCTHQHRRERTPNAAPDFAERVGEACVRAVEQQHARSAQQRRRSSSAIERRVTDVKFSSRFQRSSKAIEEMLSALLLVPRADSSTARKTKRAARSRRLYIEKDVSDNRFTRQLNVHATPRFRK
jgi:hypothetical protein